MGYVASTHRLPRVARSPRTVLTAYHALTRQWLADARPEALRDEAAADLVATLMDCPLSLPSALQSATYPT